MRIEVSNPGISPASLARGGPASPGSAGAARARTAAGFLDALGSVTRGGPEGAGDRAGRLLRESQKVADAEAMVAPGEGVPVEPPAPRAPATGSDGQAARPPREPNARQVEQPGSVRVEQASAGARESRDEPAPESPGAARSPSPAAGPAVSAEGVSARAGRAEPAGVARVEGVGGAAGRSGPSPGTPAGLHTGAGQRGSPAGAGPVKASGASMLRYERAEIAPQLSKSLAMLLQRSGGSVEIRLQPEALGHVRVEVTVRDGVVRARFEAESEQARGLLRSELDRLRSMLEHRGLRVERLEIASDRAERESPAGTDDGRGGWRMPAEDEPGGGGREAAGRSPWTGDQGGSRGGAPGGRAERGPTEDVADPAEPGDPASTGMVEPLPGRSRGVGSIRLDIVA